MRSNYKPLGQYIQIVNIRNTDLKGEMLLGVSIKKILISSIANTIGTNMSTYKLIKRNQFAYGPVTSRNGDKISVAQLVEYENAIVSQAYVVFEVINTKKLDPEYLMMWFRRPEFDRYARFKSHGSARETFDWDEMCEVELPVPTIEKQREIVKEYNIIVNRITLNEQLNQKLEETAQALYKHWFVDFEFPNENGQPYKSSGGKMVYNEELDQEIPEEWKNGELSEIATIIMGQSPSGKSYNSDGLGEIFYQGRTEFGFRFPKVKNYTTEPKRKAKNGDILMSVRAPVGDLNIANSDCCIGRGIASLKLKNGLNSFLFYLMLEVRRQFDIANDEGTVFGSITKYGLHEIKILIPNQSKINKFNTLIIHIDNKIKNQCQQILALIKTRDFILSKMTKIKNRTEKAI